MKVTSYVNVLDRLSINVKSIQEMLGSKLKYSIHFKV